MNCSEMSYFIDSTQYDWIDGSYLRIDRRSSTSIIMKANKEGLISLANQLMQLANGKETVAMYQTWPGDLEEGSLELEICRVNQIGRKSYTETITISTESDEGHTLP